MNAATRASGSGTTHADCARTNCAEMATVLLAYDPRRATAWLRDLVVPDPSLGLLLCRDHAESRAVPMSWDLIDERAAEAEYQGSWESPAEPSFDDIFPPRADADDNFDLDAELDHAHEVARVDDPAETPRLELPADMDTGADEEDDWFGDADDWYDDEEDAAELLAPEIDEHEAESAVLPASGTDGVPLNQPQLPYTQDAPSRTFRADPEPRFDDLDFLYEEDPAERLTPEQRTTLAERTSSGDRRMSTSPELFGTTTSAPRLSVSASSPLLSRAFRNSATD